MAALLLGLYEAAYYREQAKRVRRLAGTRLNRDDEAMLSQIARDYDDIAEDLESGAIQIRHPELMPQTRARR